ncbi:undecaprenyl-phosphate glucose phosphotransferase, partial [Pseudoduganella sp. RAF53_2]
MTVNDLPIVAFFQRVLDPLIIMGTLYFTSVLYGEPFTGYSLVLMVLAFFISSSVYQQVDPYRMWRSGRILAYSRDIFMGWIVTAIILVFLGNASGLAYHYETSVVLSWFFATPFALLFSHLAARKVSVDPAKASEVRSVLIVGANDVGAKFARTIDRYPNLFLSVRGFFDDRGVERMAGELNYPVLGKMDDVAAYVRENNIKMIFISQPISAQPRIRKLLDDLQDTTASVYFLP